jgi:hypothetical protein
MAATSGSKGDVSPKAKEELNKFLKKVGWTYAHLGTNNQPDVLGCLDSLCKSPKHVRELLLDDLREGFWYIISRRRSNQARQLIDVATNSKSPVEKQLAIMLLSIACRIIRALTTEDGSIDHPSLRGLNKTKVWHVELPFCKKIPVVGHVSKERQQTSGYLFPFNVFALLDFVLNDLTNHLRKNLTILSSSIEPLDLIEIKESKLSALKEMEGVDFLTWRVIAIVIRILLSIEDFTNKPQPYVTKDPLRKEPYKEEELLSLLEVPAFQHFLSVFPKYDDIFEGHHLSAMVNGLSPFLSPDHYNSMQQSPELINLLGGMKNVEKIFHIARWYFDRSFDYCYRVRDDFAADWAYTILQWTIDLTFVSRDNEADHQIFDAFLMHWIDEIWRKRNCISHPFY